jgi:hypothetical protein
MTQGNPGLPVRRRRTRCGRPAQPLVRAATDGRGQPSPARGRGDVPQRLKAMAGRLGVRDAHTGETRPARYGDMMILLRRRTGLAELRGGAACARHSLCGRQPAAVFSTPSKRPICRRCFDFWLRRPMRWRWRTCCAARSLPSAMRRSWTSRRPVRGRTCGFGCAAERQRRCCVRSRAARTAVFMARRIGAAAGARPARPCVRPG